MKRSAIAIIVLAILALIILLWYLGAKPNVVTVGEEGVLLRTAQAIDFTVQHPYGWAREFISIPQLEEDTTVIPQGISEDKPLMVLYPAGESRTIRILFSVNDLSLSGLTLEEYSELVEKSISEYPEFNLINKESQQGRVLFEYMYTYNNESLTEIKKFTYKNGKLLSVIATLDSDLRDDYYGITKQIIETASLR